MVETRRYAGFGNETVFGTAVAAAFHVDMASATLDTPSEVEMLYPGGISRGVRTRRPGYYRPAGNIVYGWDIRTIAYLLRWALGGYVFTAGTPNQHEIYGSANNTLPSFTSRIGKDVFEHVFAGCVCGSLELDLAADFLLATMSVSAQKDSKAALTAVDALLLPDEFPLAFHEVGLSIAAGDVSADVKALKLNINNNERPDSGRSIGSRFPRRLPVGGRDITGTMELWFADTAQLERFWGNATTPAATGATDLAAIITANAGADGSLSISLPSIHYPQVNLQPEGRDEITQSISFRALEDDILLDDAVTTVRSELLATVLSDAPDLEP